MSEAVIRGIVQRWAPAILQPLGVSEVGKLVAGWAGRQTAALALLRVPERKTTRTGAEALLLRPDRPPVPFAGRVAEMAEFDDWFHTEEILRWRLITGPGGRGKTRLMMEIAGTLAREAGRATKAGFLDLVD